jgi:hypothetical protein
MYINLRYAERRDAILFSMPQDAKDYNHPYAE